MRLKNKMVKTLEEEKEFWRKALLEKGLREVGFLEYEEKENKSVESRRVQLKVNGERDILYFIKEKKESIFLPKPKDLGILPNFI